MKNDSKLNDIKPNNLLANSISLTATNIENATEYVEEKAEEEIIALLICEHPLYPVLQVKLYFFFIIFIHFLKSQHLLIFCHKIIQISYLFTT